MKKKLLLGLMICAVFLAMSTPAFAGDVKLLFNGKNLQGDVDAFIESGRTMVPLRLISESLGAEVGWDGPTRTVTLNKNGKVVKITLDSKIVYVNDVKDEDLDVPARSIEGRTIVPARFISETFGAEVDCEPATRTVIIDHVEERDGMLPEELYAKSVEAMADIESYSFKGNGTMKTSFAGQTMNTGVVYEGVYKSPFEMYFKETIDMSDQMMGQTITVEMYIDEDMNMYINNMGQGWQKFDSGLAELNAGLMDGLNNQKQDPSSVLNQIDQFGLIFSHGNEAVIDGKDYYVLYVRLDQQKYIDKVTEVMNEMELPSEEEALNDAELDEAMNALNTLFQDMKFDVSYKLYLDKETYYTTKMDINSYIEMSLDSLAEQDPELNADLGSMEMYLDMEMDLGDFGSDVTMPQIDL